MVSLESITVEPQTAAARPECSSRLLFSVPESTRLFHPPHKDRWSDHHRHQAGPGPKFAPPLPSSQSTPSESKSELARCSRALDDFQTLNLKPTQGNEQKNVEDKGKKPSLPTNVQGLGLGLGLPDLRAKKKGTQKGASHSESHVTETLDQLRQQTREAVKNIESMSGGPKAGEDLSKDAMMEEWVKQFEELSGSQDMESMVETMMQQLLSKDILYKPMKEIGERYPKWLEDHKSSLSAGDYERFSHQYELIQELNGVYDSDPGNFTRIVELMQKMQECGQPPNDIVSELAPDFDISSLGQLSPEMLEAQQNCCIM